MMEVLYYPYWKISLCVWIPLFIISNALLIYVLVDKDKADSEIGMISDFYLYFKEVHPGLIIGKILLVIILYFINFSLSILNIYYFNPNFILISYHLSKIVKILIELIKDDPGKLYILIFFAIQFFSLMIYLEILELNFCNLNENTRRNINLRGLLDVSGETGRDSTVIDINKDYSIDKSEIDDKKEPNIEMIHQETAESKISSSTKKLIILGDLNSKYLLSLGLALGQIVYNIIINYFPEDKKNMVLDLYSTSLGIICVSFIPYILKFAAKNKQNDKAIQKKKCLHY